MTQSAEIEVTSEAFARRLANLVAARRAARGVSVRRLALQSRGAVTTAQLKAVEAGTAPLDHELIDVVADLYEVDLAAILPTRLPVTIDDGCVVAGGVSAAFSPNDPDSLLLSYLRLVRRMRKLERAPFVDLRRDDIDALAGYLRSTGEAVIDRLGSLMGASRTQRSAMAAMFASGAVVIGLVGGAAAAGVDTADESFGFPQSESAQVVVVDAAPHDSVREIVVVGDASEVTPAGNGAISADVDAARVVVARHEQARTVHDGVARSERALDVGEGGDAAVSTVHERRPSVDPGDTGGPADSAAHLVDPARSNGSVTNEVGPPPIDPAATADAADGSNAGGSSGAELVPAETTGGEIEQEVGAPPVAPAVDAASDETGVDGSDIDAPPTGVAVAEPPLAS